MGAIRFIPTRRVSLVKGDDDRYIIRSNIMFTFTPSQIVGCGWMEEALTLYGWSMV